jgi:hypothetical protein
MAAPNIVNVSSIYGKTAYDVDVGVSVSAVVTNAAGSNKVLKINTLIIANIDGTNAADITITVRNAAGGTIYSTLAHTVSVPADSTLVVISKDTSIYLEEDRSLGLIASSAGDLSATCSYEELDDA